MGAAPAVLLASLLLAACLGPRGGGPPVARRLPAAAPAPVPEPAPAPDPSPLSPLGGSLAPVPEGELPAFTDDGGLMDLAASVRQSLDYFRSLPPGSSFVVGPERVSADRMARGLEAFLGLMELTPAEFQAEVPKVFRVYRPEGKATFSAYYEHGLDASLERKGIYQFPIYAKPPDLVERESPSGKVVGRMAGGELVPYFTREEIDSGGALEGKDLEIAWAADPLEIFQLQVQGSGWLNLEGEENPVRVRFAAHNGQPYRSVGQNMIKKGLLSEGGTAREKMTTYMREHPEERQGLLNVNPRYVFFQLDHGPDAPFAIGALRRPLTPRRSVAADKAIFPPGALAFMETGNPAARRFVLIQDEGGAIKGPKRIDYFVGAGDEAEDYAVRFWTEGRFTVLIPR